MEKGKCRFCDSDTEYIQRNEDNSVSFGCPLCGHYALSAWDFGDKRAFLSVRKDAVASYLYHNNKLMSRMRPDDYTCFVGSNERFQGLKDHHLNYHHASIEEIKTFWLLRFSDRIDKILLALAKRSRFFGDQVFFYENELASLMLITRVDEDGQAIDSLDITEQIAEICNYLDERLYTRIENEGDNRYITLLSDGWSRIDEIQRQNADNRDVFVSMSFADEAKSTREAIRKGIVSAEFSPEFMDEIIHNKQIVPEMFRLIRECRLLILDISEPNYGAYYEAGYALGLGKEVIISCSKERYTHKYESEDEKKYERYLRPHFDIAQKQLLIWDDYDDLSKKICEWIKALIR